MATTMATTTLPSDAELEKLVEEELSRPGLDLGVVTRKSVRKDLSERLGVDLTPKKAVINAAIMAFFTRQQEDQEQEQQRRNGVGASSDGGSSSVKQEGGEAVKQEEAQSHPQKQQHQQQHASEQAAEDGEHAGESSDEEEGKSPRQRVSVGDMDLSDSDIEDSEFVRKKKQKRKSASARNSTAGAGSKKAASGSSSKSSGSSGTARKGAPTDKLYVYNVQLTEQDEINKGKTAYTYELELAEPLAEFLGEKYMARSEVTKRIWAYIRENNLPTKKGCRILDDKLSSALGRKTISFKTLPKALKTLMKPYRPPETYTIEDHNTDQQPVVKLLWAYIKENGLQDPRDGRRILCDDKMKAVFPDEMTAFSMNKFISPHLS
ncbi:hypothetical protein PTSG_09146 [Salpingoeca rosetta]|uniref:DM2 domain-containing protein n=1 Tax=Salpingoeca rosetta (strain ATCC 50818 / BSB-021) TaxID=946362 RepID=F2UMV2_SALR5|nr:uncharacterized protein PTSG_09146 [Salpingoeca rosetta]EGD78451.1 hypothetical protein PTSG_09146 [Salpingoeca rosetta]|eukprot:XP_004989400.1 hypothetical protein PTSG_09146 [Salpingoeca rosetta]